MATTGQFVGGQGCWDVEGSRWREAGGRVSVNVRVADTDFLWRATRSRRNPGVSCQRGWECSTPEGKLGCEIGGRWSEKEVPATAIFRRLVPPLEHRSFGLSLLEHRGGFGVDGETPQPQPCLRSSDMSVWIVERAM